MTIADMPGQFIASGKIAIRQMMRYWAAIMLVVFLPGCAWTARAPMDVLTYECPGGKAANRPLLVFMRGLGGSHYSFEEEGFVADIRARGLLFDIAAPNAHFGYYGDRNLVTRLKEDVIDPARAKGCRKVWLVGVSMGGLGALLYLMERPQDIAGIFLIAPFLGTPAIFEEIKAAGGVRQWDPGPYKAEDDWERMLWHWLKTTIADHPEKLVYLGYGADDPYQNGQQLLADLLPPDRVYAIDGGHDYRTFKALWKNFLANDAKLRN